MGFTHWVFDLDETLTLRHVTIRRVLPEFFARLQGADFPIQDFQQFQKFYFELDQNGRGKDPLFAELFRLAGGKLTLETLNQWYYELYIAAIELAPEARACLEGITRAGGKIGLITNGPPTQWAKIQKLRLQELFGDCIIVSSDVGVAKPDPRIFRLMEEKMGPGRYIYVGDSLDHDIAGARGAGWSAAWINRAGVSASLPRGAFRIESLTELLRAAPPQEISPEV